MSRIKIRQNVTRLRGADYPEPGEQLDALWKIVRAVLPHVPKAKVPADALEVMERVAAVKARFPKRP